MLNRLQDVFRSFQQYDVRYVVIGDVAPVLRLGYGYFRM